jgi:hypothetical protein
VTLFALGGCGLDNLAPGHEAFDSFEPADDFEVDK